MSIENKEILIGLSYGDQLGHQYGVSDARPLLTIETFRETFRQYQELGVDTILFRIDVLRWVRDYHWPEPRVHWKGLPQTSEEELRLETIQRQWAGAHQAVEANLLKDAVDIAHEHSLRIFAWSTTFDEGMPLDMIWYSAGERGAWNNWENRYWKFDSNWRSPCISKFTAAHPECVMVDRSQMNRNWGTLEFAYPEARQYAVAYNRWFLENYSFDGIYIDFRNEFSRPVFADQFGFGQLIVDEYQRRYGTNILKEQFDLERWRRLCGEYLTQFIRELSAMAHSKGKALLVGIPQGNYIGLPNGNMYLDWQNWVKEHIVDELVIGVISGRFIFPERVGYGYLTDMEADIGLPNLLWDLQNNYWPQCARYGVKLHVYSLARPAFVGPKIPVVEFFKTNVHGLVLHSTLLQALQGD